MDQDKDIEIERLQTTVYTLNQKIALLKDIEAENYLIKNRREEQDRARELLEEEVL